MIARLPQFFYWCGMAITLMCEIATLTIFAAIVTNRLRDHSEAWMAVWFFAVIGGVAWIVGRAARSSWG